MSRCSNSSGLMYSTYKEFKFTYVGETAGVWRLRSRSNGIVTKLNDEQLVARTKKAIIQQIKEKIKEMNWDKLHGDMPASLVIDDWREQQVGKPTWFQRAASQGYLAPTNKPDCDGVIKLILDSISKLVVVDDKQFVEVVYHRHYCNKQHPKPCVDVSIKLYYQDYSEIRDSVVVHKEVTR